MNLSPLHPPVVHFPIALLLLGSVAALLSLFGPRAFKLMAPVELRALAWWPLRLGWLGTALAVLTGLFDQGRLPPQAPYSATLNWHIGSGLALLLVYGTLLYRQWLWNKQRRPVDGVGDLLDSPAARTWVALLLVTGAALVLLSGWLGGSLVYTWGVNVDAPSH